MQILKDVKSWMLDAKQEEALALFLKQEKTTAFCARSVKRENEKGKKSTAVLIFTPEFATFLVKKRFSKEMIRKEKYNWFKIRSIGIDKEKRTTIEFNKGKMIFYDKEPQDMITSAVNFIKHILVPEQISLISIPPLISSSTRPNASSILFRIRYYLRKYDISINQSLFENIATQFEIKSSLLTFPELPPVRRIYAIFFSCLSCKTPIQEILFEKITDFDIFELIISKYQFLEKIKKFQFKQPITGAFIDSFKEIQKNSLQEISFSDANFNDNQIATIVKLIKEEIVPSLSFSNSLKADDVHRICSSPSFEKLRYFHLNCTNNLGLQTLIPCLRNLFVISFCNADISIGVLLEIMQNSELLNLRELNLSGNQGTELDQPNIKLPPNLWKIFATNVKWDKESFINYASIVFNHQPENDQSTTISLAGAQFTDTTFEEVIPIIAQSKAEKLTNLIWDGNPLSSDFVDFIIQCPLTHLSISRSGTQKQISLLVKILKSIKTLQFIWMKGSKTSFIADLSDFFVNGPSATNLISLNISGNRINDSSLQNLGVMVNNSPNLKELCIEDLGVSSPQIFHLFLESIINREAPINISYPLKDVTNWIKQAACEKADVIKMKYQLKMMRKPKTERRPFPESFPIFTEPYSVYYYNEEDSFNQDIRFRSTTNYQYFNTAFKKLKNTIATLASKLPITVRAANIPTKEESNSSSYLSSSYELTEEEEEEEDIPSSSTPLSIQMAEESTASFSSHAPRNKRPLNLVSSNKIIPNDKPRSRSLYNRQTSERNISRSLVNQSTQTPVHQPKMPIIPPESSFTPLVKTSPTRMREDSTKKIRWEFPLRYVPEIDNTVQLENLNSQYSLQTLISELRQT